MTARRIATRKTRIDHDLDRMAYRLARASTTLPAVIDHLNEQLMYATYGTSDSDSGRTSGGDTSDPTVAAVFRRDPLTNLKLDVIARRKAVGDAIDALDDVCRTALGYRRAEAEATPTCAGGDPSTWGTAGGCGRYVEHFERADGTVGFRHEMLCAMHRKRKERHERGLTPEPEAA